MVGKISDIGTALTTIAVDDLGEWEKASDGSSAKARAGVSGAACGTSFPGSPTTGDRFWRSDRGIEYYYDGTRWLSTQIFTIDIQVSNGSILDFTANGSQFGNNPFAGDYTIYLLTYKTASLLTNGTTGSNYFTLNLNADGVQIGSVSTQGDTQNAWTTHSAAINATSTAKMFSVDHIETGAATIRMTASLTFRLVG